MADRGRRALAGQRRARRADQAVQGAGRPSTSTTRAARSCSSGSASCPSTTPRAPSWRSSRDHAAEIVGRHRRRRAGRARLRRLGQGARAARRDARQPGTLRRYIPLDVSASVVARRRASSCVEDYEGLQVHGVVGDLERHLEHVPAADGVPRLVALLGGTIGNFPPGTPARACWPRSPRLLGPDDRLLLGTDLVKDPAVIEAAYNDSEGVTAEFNRNLLHVVNRELDADFVPEAFDHVAFFDRRHEWVEMRLRARRPCSVLIAELDLRVEFAAGEELRTEISAKFTRERVEADLDAAGLELERWFTDEQACSGSRSPDWPHRAPPARPAGSRVRRHDRGALARRPLVPGRRARAGQHGGRAACSCSTPEPPLTRAMVAAAPGRADPPDPAAAPAARGAAAGAGQPGVDRRHAASISTGTSARPACPPPAATPSWERWSAASSPTGSIARRPLWEATLIEGLSGGRQALLMKVHHALVDGMAAIGTGRAGARPDPGAARDPARRGRLGAPPLRPPPARGPAGQPAADAGARG